MVSDLILAVYRCVDYQSAIILEEDCLEDAVPLECSAPCPAFIADRGIFTATSKNNSPISTPWCLSISSSKGPPLYQIVSHPLALDHSHLPGKVLFQRRPPAHLVYSPRYHARSHCAKDLRPSFYFRPWPISSISTQPDVV